MKGRRGGRGGIPRDDDDDDFGDELDDASILETIFPSAFGYGISYDVPLTSKAAQEGAQRLRKLFGAGAAPADQSTAATLIRGLSGESLLMLRLAAEIGKLVARPFLDEEAKLLLRRQAAQAIADLQARGLLLAERLFGQEHIGVPRDIAPMLLSHLPPLDTEAAEQRPSGPAPQGLARLPFELALVVAAVWTLRPRRTQAGPLYRKDDERMRALLGPGFPLDERLGQLGALGMTTGTDVLLVPVEEAERLAGMTVPALSVLMTAQQFTGPRRHVLSLLLRGRPPGGFFPVEALERAMRVGILQGANYYQDHGALRRVAQNEVAGILRTAGLEQVEVGGVRAVRLWQGEAEEAQAGRVHLQPSFEVLVPPDAPAGVLLDLARVAALTKVDQVVTLTLSRESVLRGLEGGLDVEGVLAILGRHAFAGVPQNVAASVRGWAGHGGRAHFAEGMVVALTREAEVRPLLAQRVTDGVYLINPGSRSVVERRLRALDVAPAEGVARLREGLGEAPRGVALPPVLPAADDELTRARVQQAQARIAAPPPKEAAPKEAGPPPRTSPLPKPSAAPVPLKPSTAPVAPAPPRPSTAPIPPRSSTPIPPNPGAPVPKVSADADPVPAGTQFNEYIPSDLELALRRAVRLRRQLYVKLSTGQGPWRLQPQRLTHRGRQICLEAFRASVNEYRIIPLEMINQLAVA
jgi:hypothetical protein